MTHATHRYTLHGLHLAATSDHPAVLAALHPRLRRFSAQGSGPTHLTFAF